MESKTVTSSILERARAAQAAQRVADEEARCAHELRRQVELRSEWRPIVDAVLAQVKHQLGDDGEPTVDDEGWCTRYYGEGWMLERPAEKTIMEGEYSTLYRPLKLMIGNDIRTPVMCWNDGRAQVCFVPAEIIVDDEDDYATLYLGSAAISDWGIQQGNHNLLLAIAQAADKQTEYVTKAHKVESLNAERYLQNATPEPAATKRDNLESANEVMLRFAEGDYCVCALEDQSHDDAELKYADNRAYLLASQIYALARELRGLREDMEALRHA